jgi:hypothetical protein
MQRTRGTVIKSMPPPSSSSASTGKPLRQPRTNTKAEEQGERERVREGREGRTERCAASSLALSFVYLRSRTARDCTGWRSLACPKRRATRTPASNRQGSRVWLGRWPMCQRRRSSDHHETTKPKKQRFHQLYTVLDTMRSNLETDLFSLPTDISTRPLSPPSTAQMVKCNSCDEKEAAFRCGTCPSDPPMLCVQH